MNRRLPFKAPKIKCYNQHTNLLDRYSISFSIGTSIGPLCKFRNSSVFTQDGFIYINFNFKRFNKVIITFVLGL